MLLKRFALVLIILILAAFAGGYYYLNYPLSVDIDLEEEEIYVDEDNRYQVGPVEVIKLEGSPYEIGYQHGELLADEVEDLIVLMYEEALEFEEETLPRRLLGKLYMRRAALSFFDQIPERFRQELQGVADGADLPLYDILLINVYDELFNLVGCTNLAVWGESSYNNELLMGRNLDYYYPEVMYDRQILTYYIPEEGSQFLAADFPGYIGVLTGLNQQGLALGSLTAQAKETSLDGVPTGILYRMIMESAASLDDAEDMLKENSRTIGNNLLVAADYSQKASVMEISPAEVYRRRPADRKNFIAVANHFNELENDLLFKSSVFRQDRAEELLEKYTKGENNENVEGSENDLKMNRQDVINILNDREEIEIEGYGFHSIGNQRNVQSAVIQPEQLKFWLSINQSLPAAGQGFYGFELNPEEKSLREHGLFESRGDIDG